VASHGRKSFIIEQKTQTNTYKTKVDMIRLSLSHGLGLMFLFSKKAHKIYITQNQRHKKYILQTFLTSKKLYSQSHGVW